MSLKNRIIVLKGQLTSVRFIRTVIGKDCEIMEKAREITFHIDI